MKRQKEPLPSAFLRVEFQQVLPVVEHLTRGDIVSLAAGQDCGEAANIAKLLASEAAWNAADTCFQTFGGFAFAREYHIERKWREVRLFQTAPISTNMILNYIALNVLGLPRSYWPVRPPLTFPGSCLPSGAR